MVDREQGYRADLEEMGLLRALGGRLEESSRSREPPPQEAQATRRVARRVDQADDDLTIITRPREARTVVDLVAELRSSDLARRRSVLRSLRRPKPDMASAAAAATALEDPELEIRSLALEVLEAAPHLAPVDALAAATKDDDGKLRARALVMLGKTGNPAVLETLAERVGPGVDEAEVSAALEGLLNLVEPGGAVRRDGPVVDRVMSIVGSLDPDTRLRLGGVIARIARAIPEEEIGERLGSSSVEVRRGAAVLASERDTPGALQALALLTDDQEPEVLRLAGLAASRVRPKPLVAGPDVSRPARMVTAPEDLERVIPTLLDVLEDPEADVRTLARDALARLEGAGARRWFRDQVRQAAPEDLVRLAGHAVRLGADELLPIVADAALALPPGPERDRIAEALRESQSAPQIIDRWATDPEAPRRADAVRLASLVRPWDLDPVVRGLADPSADVRLAAIDACGQAADGVVADSLMRVISGDSNPEVRHRGVLAFRASPLPRRRRLAESAASSPDREVRLAALRLLEDSPADETPALARYLRDPDPEVAAAAGRMLAGVDTGEALAMLWTSLASADTAVRRRSIEVLDAFDRRSLGRLAEVAAASPAARERALGFAVLARIDPESAGPSLVEGLADPSPAVRLEVLTAMRRHPRGASIDAVGARLRDPEPDVRREATSLLAETLDDRVTPYLVQAAADSSEEVRGVARQAILARRSPSVADVLIAALGDPERSRPAAQLLAEMAEESRELLLSALSDADEHTRRAIADVLAQTGAEAWLIHQLEHRDPARRREAAAALGVMGSSAAVPSLIDRLSDPDPAVRRMVAGALGRIGDRRALDALKRAFVSDPDMDVVAEIEPALRRLASDASPPGGDR